MDIKQLVTGNPKTGFYPVTQDTITVIELNKSVMSLTNGSSSEEIIAAFDNLESFQALIAEVRNPQNICSGILVNDTETDLQVGKYEASIIAHTDTETLNVRWVENDKIVALTITNTNGIMSCIRIENNVDGNKTNVLILSLENDLANGQKDSPVDAEVSTALKDAISTGKACVIKSANSDILANLQQTGDNVTIIMEQISRIGQTFVAVNTTITVNTATNVISDYQTGAIVLETEGDGSKFLSNDGSYKDINSSSVIIPVNLVLDEVSSSDSSGYDFSEIWEAYNSGKTVYLKDSNELHYLVVNIATNGVSYFAVNSKGTYSGKPELYWFYNVNYGGAIGTVYQIDIIGNSNNILYKDNISQYIPTDDYNPATKKYVDDHSADLSNYLAKNNTDEYTPTEDYNPSTKKYVDDHSPLSKIITESEYTALGETVNTDGILYFVTPDA